jgi:hypothetical protein
MQLVEPLFGWYVPRAHAVHTNRPAEAAYDPALHPTQAVRSAFGIWPAGQLLHVDLPGSGWI